VKNVVLFFQFSHQQMPQLWESIPSFQKITHSGGGEEEEERKKEEEEHTLPFLSA
jgi:hypothetical protein